MNGQALAFQYCEALKLLFRKNFKAKSTYHGTQFLLAVFPTIQNKHPQSTFPFFTINTPELMICKIETLNKINSLPGNFI